MIASSSCHGDGNAFYRHVIQVLNEQDAPFLLGGAYALGCYTGIVRDTKDVDVFVRPADCRRTLEVLRDAGYATELTFPHWLGKAFCHGHFVDLIFSSGNGIARVDDLWFEHARPAQFLGEPVKLAPIEEMIWSKAYVCERERFDGADINHLLRAHGHELDWARLLDRFGRHWRVLLGHLVLFGFVYPRERDRIPAPVLDELLERVREEMRTPPPRHALCQGPLLSRSQYRADLEQWGYHDGRLDAPGCMSPSDIALWTAAAEKE